MVGLILGTPHIPSWPACRGTGSRRARSSVGGGSGGSLAKEHLVPDCRHVLRVV